MPMAMQLIGSWFADETVLNAAHAYQSATDWHRRRPAIAAHS
jgi:aspartyl-tRNA(Asn)/glutamyl-tRNA(Gln) amidotransferase subunit A